jgi:hypothetical protein
MRPQPIWIVGVNAAGHGIGQECIESDRLDATRFFDRWPDAVHLEVWGRRNNQGRGPLEILGQPIVREQERKGSVMRRGAAVSSLGS